MAEKEPIEQLLRNIHEEYSKPVPQLLEELQTHYPNNFRVHPSKKLYYTHWSFDPTSVVYVLLEDNNKRLSKRIDFSGSIPAVDEYDYDASGYLLYHRHRKLDREGSSWERQFEYSETGDRRTVSKITFTTFQEDLQGGKSPNAQILRNDMNNDPTLNAESAFKIHLPIGLRNLPTLTFDLIQVGYDNFVEFNAFGEPSSISRIW